MKIMHCHANIVPPEQHCDGREQLRSQTPKELPTAPSMDTWRDQTGAGLPLDCIRTAATKIETAAAADWPLPGRDQSSTAAPQQDLTKRPAGAF